MDASRFYPIWFSMFFICIFNYKSEVMKVFCSYKTNGLFWFRIFGRGLCIKNVNKHPLTFSQRNGYRKVIRIGKLCISYLKKN